MKRTACGRAALASGQQPAAPAKPQSGVLASPPGPPPASASPPPESHRPLRQVRFPYYYMLIAGRSKTGGAAGMHGRFEYAAQDLVARIQEGQPRPVSIAGRSSLVVRASRRALAAPEDSRTGRPWRRCIRIGGESSSSRLPQACREAAPGPPAPASPSGAVSSSTLAAALRPRRTKCGPACRECVSLLHKPWRRPQAGAHPNPFLQYRFEGSNLVKAPGAMVGT